eukprot:gene2088-biopygen9224
MRGASGKYTLRKIQTVWRTGAAICFSATSADGAAPPASFCTAASACAASHSPSAANGPAAAGLPLRRRRRRRDICKL